MEEHYQHLYEALSQVDGYIYPNEIELHWGLMIVLYPYITGLVAGAFILASLERVFNVKVLKPTYVLSLLTALSFLVVATLPLVSHLQHPFRSYEIFMTPNPTSAMAIFGFVYLWYLMAVLLLEIWLDYRRDFVIWAKESTGFKKIFYSLITLGINDSDDKSAKLDDKLGYFITVIGIPSAFLLHGYVGFIFGSIKANPLVVYCTDARYFSIFSHGFRNSPGNGDLYGSELGAKSKNRHELFGYNCQISLLCSNY